MQQLVSPILVMAILGGLFALLLGIVSKLTYIPVDERIIQVREALPGANCGACGFPGCDGCAEAMVKGNAAVSACVVGGEKVSTAVAEILGKTSDGAQRMVASVQCQGDCARAQNLFHYDGVQDCRIMGYQFGGAKACKAGCVGCGTCYRACNYDAIRIVDGIAVIDEEKCVQCMACINVCPKKVISLVPYHATHQVKCMNPAFGKTVKEVCQVGCIGCGLCAKMAPESFQMEGKLAKAVYTEDAPLEKVAVAAQKCPGKCIVTPEVEEMQEIA